MQVEQLKQYIDYLKKEAVFVEEYKNELIELNNIGNFNDILTKFIELVRNNFTKENSESIDGNLVISNVNYNRQLYLNMLLTLYYARDVKNNFVNIYIYCIIYSVVEIDMMLEKAPKTDNEEFKDYINNLIVMLNSIFKNNHFPKEIYDNENLRKSIQLFIDIFILTE